MIEVPMFSNDQWRVKEMKEEIQRSKISYDLRPITLNYDMMMMANEENRVNTKNVRTQNVVTKEEQSAM